MAEAGSINMLVNGFLTPAHDPGSHRYADSLSVHMRSILLSRVWGWSVTSIFYA